MSLDDTTLMQGTNNEKERAMIELAEKLVRILAERGKKAALNYFNSLSPETQAYIRVNRNYEWAVRAARLCGI